MRLLKSRWFHFSACIVVAAGIATACDIEETQYTFNGKTYDESQLEEHLADLIEVENTDLDIEVNIYQESDD